MDTSIDRLDKIAAMMQQRGVARVRIEEGDASIELEGPGAFPAPVAPAVPVSTQPVAAAAPASAAPQAATAAPAAPAASDASPDTGDGEAPLDMTKVISVKAPMVGIFYAAPSPGAKPFVQVGDKVKKGDVLCVIEAMKEMKEVTAQADGEVVDICVSDGELVEYGAVLMKLY